MDLDELKKMAMTSAYNGRLTERHLGYSGKHAGNYAVSVRNKDLLELLDLVNQLTEQNQMKDKTIVELEKACTEAQTNDRFAMSYLSEIREIIDSVSFPDMINKIKTLKTEADTEPHDYHNDQTWSYPLNEPIAWMDREGDIYLMPEIEHWCPPHIFLYAGPPPVKK